MLFFATRSYGYFRDELASLVRGEVGRLEVKLFSDGEVYHRILDDVAGRNVVLVGASISDVETFELFDVASGLVNAGAHSLTLVVPYYGYATMDRAVHPGEIVKAKTRARLFSSIGHARQSNRMLLLDLHAEGIQHYFEGGLLATHLYGKALALTAIRELGGDDFVAASTDAGRAKWVESLANELQAPASFIFKRRREDGSPEIIAMNADVRGKRVVVYDDMIRSGRSLLNAAEAYRHAGAVDVACVTTHGVFPGDALDRIGASGLVSRIVASDSHPRAVELGRSHPDFLTVRSIAGVFAESLQKSAPRPL
ncbi:MAG TPA: ribose-phosphate diphosphokinase [Lacipirellula sp.]